MKDCLTAAVFALAAFCDTVAAGISFEEEIPAFRRDVDAWRVEGGRRGKWTDSGLEVVASGRSGFTMRYDRFPGMKPFRGADEIILGMKSDAQGKATAELAIFEFPSQKGAEPIWFSAPASRETRFRTGLDPSKKYQVAALAIRRAKGDDAPWKVAFSSLRGVFTTTKAEALRVEAETGNPLHIVREGQNEKPVLVLHNAAQERIAARGTLKVEGFRGEEFGLPVDVALDAGASARVPVRADLGKGVWRIRGGLAADDGSVASVDTRFAVMDYHGVTPKQPRGTFRLGVHWHFPRYTDGDRRLGASAMAACGAKLTRADVADMASIQPAGPDSWAFARTDGLLEELEAGGLALDAIIFRTPRWAMTMPPTNAVRRAHTVWPPVAGTFGAFCERLAARYGTRIDYYEIGNEWDLRFGGTYDEAVAVQREAYAGLKKGCPEVCVIPNGWAAAGDIPRPDGKGRTRIHEYFLKNAKDYFDVDTIHSHGAFPRYRDSISRKLFPLRERTGVADKPWYSNESALTSVWSERDAAGAVWKKILWAWAHGSVDYVWYTLRATGWEAMNAEHGYGLLTADFFPRDTYVAFAALSTVFGGGAFRRAVLDTDTRFVFEFRKGDDLVLAGWQEADPSGDFRLPVETDARRVWRVDLMGNRTAWPLAGGQTLVRFTSEPSAFVLEGATSASADAEVLRAAAARDDTYVVLIAPGAPGRPPDFILRTARQVHDFYEGNPTERERLWRGPKDCSAHVWLAREARGLRIRVEVEDDEHCAPPAEASLREGDSVEVFVSDPRGTWARRFSFAPTERRGTCTRYDARIPFDADAGFTSETLEGGIRFNLIVNDSDCDRRESALGIATEAFLSDNPANVPTVRFAKQEARP